MEPGERHREHDGDTGGFVQYYLPQWSPVNVTGNTRLWCRRPAAAPARRNGAR